MILQCYVDDRTLAILQRHSAVTGRTVEELAEVAIESEAIRSLPAAEEDSPFVPAPSLKVI